MALSIKVILRKKITSLAFLNSTNEIYLINNLINCKGLKLVKALYKKEVVILSKTVYCGKCGNEIKVRDDLVTATLFLEVVPYHTGCYARDLKSVRTLFLDNQPLNGFSGNFGFILVTIMAIGWLFFAENSSKWLSLLAIIPIGYRLYSYLIYERYTEE
jgi:hypothetical protein